MSLYYKESVLTIFHWGYAKCSSGTEYQDVAQRYRNLFNYDAGTYSVPPIKRNHHRSPTPRSNSRSLGTTLSWGVRPHAVTRPLAFVSSSNTAWSCPLMKRFPCSSFWKYRLSILSINFLSLRSCNFMKYLTILFKVHSSRERSDVLALLLALRLATGYIRPSSVSVA